MQDFTLTRQQQEVFNSFDCALQNRQSVLLNSAERGWGKTLIVNEIGFTYQALGYDVWLVSRFPASYYATQKIDATRAHIASICITNKTIAIVDDIPNRGVLLKVLGELEERGIPYVGFANWNQGIPKCF